MITSTTPGAAEAWRMAALRLSDLVRLDQFEMAKAVADEIAAGEKTSATLIRCGGRQVSLCSLTPDDIVTIVKDATQRKESK